MLSAILINIALLSKLSVIVGAISSDEEQAENVIIDTKRTKNLLNILFLLILNKNTKITKSKRLRLLLVN
jgi:hypothetical protein